MIIPLLFILSLNDFLDIGVKSCSGLGHIAIAIPEDAYQNPASSVLLKKQVSFYGVDLFSQMSFYGALGGILNKGNQGLGIYILRFYSGNIPDTRDALQDLNNNGILDPGDYIISDKVKYISISEDAFIINYSQRPNKKLSIGASGKIIYSNLYYSSGYRAGIDIGFHYSLYPEIHIAGVLRDLFTTPEYYPAQNIQATKSGIFGFGWEKDFTKDWTGNLEGDILIQKNRVNETLSIKALYQNMFYLSLTSSDDFIIIGSGFSHHPFSIDYTLNIHTDLPASHLISITYYL